MSANAKVQSLGERLASISQITLINAAITIALVVIASSFFSGLITVTGSTKGTAAVLAENTSAILLFDDPTTAEGLLASLRNADNVEAVAIYRQDRKPFAKFIVGKRGVPDTLPAFEASFRYGLTAIEVVQPIMNGADTLGMLYLLVSLKSLYLIMLAQLGVAVVAVLLALISGKRLAARLSNAALQPLSQLTQLMDEVSTDANLKIRAPASDIRELDTLARGFNGMLGQIHERDVKLAAHRDRLEEEVRTRTVELIEARDSAQASSRAKSEFLATMSHEIRTPMNGVLGMTELLLYDNLTDEQRRFALSVQSSGRHLLGIINAILDFSKIESGHMELETVDFSVGDLVEDTLEMFAQQAEEKGLELACRVSPPDFPSMLRGDPFRLRQVLTNLLSNAIKFTSKGEVIVSARLARSDTGVEFCLAVEDSGIGVPLHAQSRIFEHFAQADGSTTRQFGGTGLGLAICKRLVELMGGSIAVASEPGHGATFTVRLVLPEGMPLQQAAAEVEPLGGVRILVVDDNATNREILKEHFSSWDMRVSSAAGGAEALGLLLAAQIDGDPFRLAVLDMHMPQMDGLQLATAIKEQPSLSALRMVMLTSTYAAGSTVDRERAGISRFVYKPIRRAELLDVVRSALSKAPAATDAENGAAATAVSNAPLLTGSVLLAEDNPVNQRVAVGMLKRLGIEPMTVTTGAEVVTLTETWQFDLILMDCQMPVMDGFQATRAIRSRKMDAQRRVPIVAMTANSLEGDREICLEAGMDDYLSKPYSLVQLEAILRRWLPGANGEAAVRAAPAGVVPVPADEAPILDSALIQQLRAIGGKELLRQVMQVYLDTTPELVAQVEQAVAATDSERLRKLAHSLKSSSGNVGAKDLAALFVRLEGLGKEGKVDDAAPLLSSLHEAHADVMNAIRKLLREEEGGGLAG